MKRNDRKKFLFLELKIQVFPKKTYIERGKSIKLNPLVKICSPPMTPSLVDCLREFDSYSPAKTNLNYGLYLMTNEEDSLKTLTKLALLPVEGELSLGVSGFFSWDLAAVRPDAGEKQLQYLALLDCSQKVEHFMKKTLSFLKICPSKEAMQDFVIQTLSSEYRFYFEGLEDSDLIAKNYVDNFRASLVDFSLHDTFPQTGFVSSSWLSDQHRFEKMQKMAQRGNITFSCVNFNDSLAINKWVAKVKDLGPADFIYLSNIYFQGRKPMELAAVSLEQLISNRSFIIDTNRFYCEPLCGKGLKQRLQQVGGKTLLETISKSDEETSALFSASRDGIAKFCP